MKNNSLLFLSILFIIFSCKKQENSDQIPLEDFYKKEIDKLGEIKPNPENADSLLVEFKKFNKDENIQKSPLLKAKLNYQLARIYAMTGNDSSKIYINQALELIDNTAQNWAEKAMIYQGMGNTHRAEGNYFQAHFYYNQSAAIVLSEKNLETKDLNKIIYLSSAAQSNEQHHQYSLAEKMNKAALALLPNIPADDVHQQRVLAQLISNSIYTKKELEKIPIYLKKMEDLHAKYPEKFNPKFLYDRKFSYYNLIKNSDSLITYGIKNIEMDEISHAKSPKNEMHANNLFISYSNLAFAYTKNKNYHLAREYFEKAEKIYSQQKDFLTPDNLQLNFKHHAEFYKNTGEKDKSIALLESLTELQEETFENESVQGIAEMNALYQIKAKDNSIKKLNENMQLNELKLKQNKLMLVIAALTVLLLFIVMGWLYFIFKQRKKREDIEKTQLQQQLLRTQMEPHFIFNTLSTLQSFIRLEKNETAIKYLNQFSRLLRSNLELSRENLVPLSEEINALENYLSLQQMRHEHAFHYEIQLPDEQDLDAVMVPPMLIQPFVENAILHGIDLHEKNGKITIELVLNHQILSVNITDSGKKITEKIQIQHSSLSRTISRERLQLLAKEYKQETGINYQTNANGGTTVALRIPTSGVSMSNN